MERQGAQPGEAGFTEVEPAWGWKGGRRPTSTGQGEGDLAFFLELASPFADIVP